MKCPKCGYHRQERDNAFTPATECPACGIVYAKHEKDKTTPFIPGATALSHLKPSPVDAVSLRKAKERVEKRLRKQLEIKVKDQRHEKTLELARRFATKEVLRRQETWGKKQGQPTDRSAAEEQHPAVAAPTPEDPSQGEPENECDVQTETIILESADIVSRDHSEPASSHSNLDDEEIRAPQAPILFESKHVDTAALVPDQEPAGFSGQGLLRFLPSIAWLILCCGVVGAFLSWTTISSVEAGVNIPVPSEISTLPLGLLLGFAYLATGVLGFAFFWVSSRISRQLRDIRRLLLLHPAPVEKDDPSPVASLDSSDDI